MVTHFIHLFTHCTCITESHYKIMSACTGKPVHEHKNSLYSCFSLAVCVRTFSHQFLLLKVLFTEKLKFRHHLFTLSSFQTCITFFRLWNTSEDILKNELFLSLKCKSVTKHCMDKYIIKNNNKKNHTFFKISSFVP